MEEDRQNPHKRRVRYSGTHPTRFSEKYKEHDPEKYRDVVEKVIRKGSTPAGMHLPICVEEILAILRIRPGQRGLDATLGYGGHSRRMLESLAGKGHLCALDVDAVEIAKTEARLRSLGYGPDILTVVRRNSGPSIFFWRIWECPPCSLITRRGDFPTKRRGLLTCV